MDTKKPKQKILFAIVVLSNTGQSICYHGLNSLS